MLSGAKIACKSSGLLLVWYYLAASGGYYISCAADRIFAQPNTITGSIGVFGNYTEYAENITR